MRNKYRAIRAGEVGVASSGHLAVFTVVIGFIGSVEDSKLHSDRKRPAVGT